MRNTIRDYYDSEYTEELMNGGYYDDSNDEMTYADNNEDELFPDYNDEGDVENDELNASDETEEDAKKSYKDYDFAKIMEDYHSGDTKRKGNAIADAINALEGMGRSIIKRKYSSYTAKHYYDLDQCAKIGIIKMLEKYDITKGIAPSTFAYNYIIHEMQAYVDTQVNKTTPHYSSNIRKIKKAIQNLELMTNKNISSIDIAQETGLTIEAVEQAMVIMQRTDEVHIDNCTDAFINANIESISSKTPEEELVENEKNQAIEEALATLSDNERDIILLFYGFMGRPESFKEIAHAINRPVDKVKKIHADALRKLRNSKLKYLFYNYAGRDKNIAKKSFALPLLNTGSAAANADVLAQIADINF